MFEIYESWIKIATNSNNTHQKECRVPFFFFALKYLKKLIKCNDILKDILIVNDK